MAGWRLRLEHLLRPHGSVRATSDQRRARLAAGMLLLLLPLLLLAFLFPDEEGGPWLSGHRLTLLAFLAIAAGYALIRVGQVIAGVLLAVATIEAALALSVSNADDHATALLVLGFYVVPIAMAGILLPVRSAAAVAGLTLAVAMALESSIGGHGVGLPDQHAMTLALQLLAVSVLAVASAAMMGRQADDLEQSRELLHQVTDNIPEVMFLVTADGSRMLYASPAYETVLGRRVDQAMADPNDWLKAVHPEDLPAVTAALAARAPVVDYRAIHPSGEIKQIQARTFPVLDPAGKPVSIVGIAEDVTAARRAQDQVREAQRQRIHLLQQLAHDLASPLSPVKIQLRLLRDQVGEGGRNGLAVVQRNVDHIQRLVEDIKDLARLEGGQLGVRRDATDLAALARQAIETLSPGAAERQVALTLDAPASLPAKADAGRITQVIYNLVGNALKFTPPGGHVELRLRTLGTEAEVAVADNGKGMRPDQLAALFRPFSQVHEPGDVRRPEDKGSGLGLYISKGIVELHGGALVASSDGPGLGSTFTFRLPLDGAGPA